MNKGSIWRKWDLHIHTPASFSHEFKFSNEKEKNKFKSDIWEKYVNELEKISDVSAIGITDYFTIEGYKKILAYRNNGRLQNFDLILPNIEFRLNKIVAQRRLNYHIIFSNEIEVNTIEKEFLEELHIMTAIGEQRKLSKANIENVGNVLKEHQETFRKQSDYVIGCTNITISLEEIIKILKNKNSIFKGNYLLVLPEEGWCLIDWDSQDHLIRKGLLIKSHALFSSNQNTIEWALGKKHLSTNDFIREFGSLKPCMHGSDAHSFERLCKPDKERYCWIKADPSFEGLKQVIYEPEERVRIQPENPEYRKNIYTLNSIEIKNSRISDEIEIEEQKIILNKNLISITGGKGSGKTALLDMMANCFEDRCKRSGEDKNSFVQRVEDQKPDLEVSLKFIGTGLEMFHKKLAQQHFFRDSKITYLPQGKILEFCGEREKLNEKIEEIIFSNKQIIDKNYRQEFDRLGEEIDSLTRNIDKTNREIYELEQETKDNILREIEVKKAIKYGELKNKYNEIKELEEILDEKIKEKIVKLKQSETILSEKHLNLENVKSNLEVLKNNLNKFIENYNNFINDLNYKISELLLNCKIPLLDFKPQFVEIEKLLKNIPKQLYDISKDIQEKRNQLSQFKGIEKTHAELLKCVEDLKSEINSFIRQLEELKNKKIKIESFEISRQKKYLDLLDKYLKLRKYYKEVINVFSEGKNKIMGEIDFKSYIYFNKEDFIELGNDVLDLRKINIDEIEECAYMLEIILAKNTEDSLAESLNEFIQKMFKNKKHLKKTRTSYDFYRWTFGNYFALSTDIMFKNIPMDKLSIGQKGTILLKLFLAEGDYPLIVDQPEENLDNKYIYDELVGAFKEAKKKRQIIIATNNANLAVNTDAEQIIIAEFKDNIISYRQGTLENSDIRKDIIPILEGGKEAFMKREEKYGF